MSIVEWEGSDALEARKETTAPIRKSSTPAPHHDLRRKQNVVVELEPRKKKLRQVKQEEEAPEDSVSSDDGSEDEYIAEKSVKQKEVVKTKGKVCNVHDSTE